MDRSKSAFWRRWAGKNKKFDGIICAAAPRKYPEELLELLEIGGKLVIPAGNEGEQKLYVITKISDTKNEEFSIW